MNFKELNNQKNFSEKSKFNHLFKLLLRITL